MSWWWRPGPGPGTPQAESALQNPASLAETSTSTAPVLHGQVQVQHPISVKVGILLDGDADYVSFSSLSLLPSQASHADIIL